MNFWLEKWKKWWFYALRLPNFQHHWKAPWPLPVGKNGIIQASYGQICKKSWSGVHPLKQVLKKLPVDQIRKISIAAPSQLKANAEKEGQHVEWLPIIIIPMNIGNNYYY